MLNNIFDETYSVFDNKTEAVVMQAIEELSVLIIAYHLTTLRNCDMIEELAYSTIKVTGTYQEFISTHNVTMQQVYSTTPTTC